MIRLVALVGFVVGFGLLLSVPLAVVHAGLQSPPVTDLPSFTAADMGVAVGVMTVGLVLAGFSAMLAISSRPRRR